VEFKQMNYPIAGYSKVHNKRRTRRTKQQREDLLKQWGESQLNEHEFCKQHGIHLKTFSSWCKSEEQPNKLSSQTNKIDKDASNPNKEAIMDHAVILELHLPKGIRLSFTRMPEDQQILTIVTQVLLCNYN